MEIILESYILDEGILEKASNLLQECMERAALAFCTTIPLKADAVITPYWTH